MCSFNKHIINPISIEAALKEGRIIREQTGIIKREKNDTAISETALE